MPEERFSEILRADCAAIWDGLHAHPFLRELAAGTLALEKFRFFLEQDNFYLVDYARCLAMGAAKSRDETELRYFTVDLNQVLEAELPSNRALLAKRDRDGGGRPRGVARRWRRRTWPTPATCRRSRCAAARSRSWRRSCRARGATWRSRSGSPREATSEQRCMRSGSAYFTLPANVEMVAAMRRDFDALVAEEGVGARQARGARARSSPPAPGSSAGSGRWPTRWSSGRICEPA